MKVYVANLMLSVGILWYSCIRDPQGFLLSLRICAYCLVLLAEEQSQQRLQAEEAEQQYQTLLHKLNITTKRSQRRE